MRLTNTRRRRLPIPWSGKPLPVPPQPDCDGTLDESGRCIKCGRFLLRARVHKDTSLRDDNGNQFTL